MNGNIIGAICIGSLSGQKINEVKIVTNGSYDDDEGIWWTGEATALVFSWGDRQKARETSLSWSADSRNWIGGRILPLYAENAYPCGANYKVS